MTFIWPYVLYLFFLVPVYVLLHIHFERKKIKDIVPFGNIEILIEAISRTKKIDFLKHLPLILKVLVLCSLITALARPIMTIYSPVKDTKVMLLIDNSISMEATDMQPNRITVAREAAKKFINNLPDGIKIGLGVFSGNVRVLVNPTFQKEIVHSALHKLDINSLEAGTATGDAIVAGSNALTFEDPYYKKDKRKNNNRILILIADGETNIGTDPIFAAAKAKVSMITIHTIGIGSSAGTIIRGGILTRLDEFSLKEIASLTGGIYFNAKNIDEMHKIYKKIQKTIRLIPKKQEVTFIPLAGVFIIFFLLQILKWTRFRLS